MGGIYSAVFPFFKERKMGPAAKRLPLGGFAGEEATVRHEVETCLSGCYMSLVNAKDKDIVKVTDCQRSLPKSGILDKIGASGVV